MKWLKTIWTEFIGLFVDDIGFAVAIVVWLAAVATLSRLGLVPMVWRGPLLFLGLAVVLGESTLRRARK
jgi:hypothetical protein